MPATTTSSPPESGFTPRKEFIREQKPAPNTFALLSIASSNFVRLYAFPLALITALRNLFEQQGMLNAFREDLTQNMCEFTLDGKPWASAKSVSSEKVLLDILAIVYQFGFTYLSTIDYGREHDDRLAMAFSKPASPPAGNRTGTPSGTPSPDPGAPKSKRMPFALSFASATVLRVIGPPLHSTPAILQAVRGSWPRGVVSEKKVGENSFEFKLKGYKCTSFLHVQVRLYRLRILCSIGFQEDTFATDSLRYILSLLAALDSHSFSLLTSISLTSRSRVKDLWIFTGPYPSSRDDVSFSDSPAPSVLSSSHGDIRRQRNSSEPPGYSSSSGANGLQSMHRRGATEPPAIHSAPPVHIRAATDEGALRPIAQPRKPAPRAQVPVSVIHDDIQRDQDGHRAILPSVISSGIEDMTGVGATGYAPTPDVFYSTSPFNHNDGPGRATPSMVPIPLTTSPRSRSNTPPSRARSPLRPVSNRAKTPPLLVSHSPSPPSTPAQVGLSADRLEDVHPTAVQVVEDESGAPGEGGTPPLLSPGVFRDTVRDSAFSSSTDASCDIPIKWTGIPDRVQDKAASRKVDAQHRVSQGPMLPGGWQPTPIEEKAEDDYDVEDQSINVVLDQDKFPESNVQEVGSRVSSPRFKKAVLGQRKSEAGVVVHPQPSLPPPVPLLDKDKGKEVGSASSGHGWVLVNVEGKSSPTQTELEQGSQSLDSVLPRSSDRPRSPVHKASNSSAIAAAKQGQPKSPTAEQSSMSPAAKAIVIIDAVDAKNKGKNQSKGRSEGTSSPGPRRFFSLSRKNSVSLSGVFLPSED